MTDVAAQAKLSQDGGGGPGAVAAVANVSASRRHAPRRLPRLLQV